MKIGEVSKILEMPKETIRFYEKSGLISSERDEINGYREYSLWDIYGILQCINYRNIGFSHKEIREFKNGVTIERIVQKYRQCIAEMRNEADRKMLLAEYLENYITSIEIAPYNLGCYWFEEMSACLSYPFSRRIRDEYVFSTNDNELLKAWTNELPFVYAGVCSDTRNIEHPCAEETDDWYYMIEERYAKILNLPLNEQVKRLPRRICFCTMIDAGEKGELSVKMFMPIIEKLKQYPYSIDGNRVYGRLLVRYINGNKMHRYIQVMIPVTKNE